MAAKVALVHLDLTGQRRVVLGGQNDDLAQAVEVVRGSLGVHPDQFRRRPRRGADNEILQQTNLLRPRQPRPDSPSS
jgi:hypothetical protein